MNAIQFIKEHGVEKARKVIDGAPEGSTHFVGSTYLKLIGAVWWNAWLPEWSHKDNCMVKKWKCESIELMKTWGEVYKLDELKNLIANIDSQIAIKFIKEWGDDYSKKYIALSESEGNILPWELSLKRLVESVDLVKEHYTLDRAIEYANSSYTSPEIKVCLLDAIADYKSIYINNDMGDDSHIENHVSPLCKVGVK